MAFTFLSFSTFFGFDHQWHAVLGVYNILDTLTGVICAGLERFSFLQVFLLGHATMITIIFEWSYYVINTLMKPLKTRLYSIYWVVWKWPKSSNKQVVSFLQEMCFNEQASTAVYVIFIFIPLDLHARISYFIIMIMDIIQKPFFFQEYLTHIWLSIIHTALVFISSFYHNAS